MATASVLTPGQSELVSQKANIAATLLRIAGDPNQDKKFYRLLKKLDAINTALKKHPKENQ